MGVVLPPLEFTECLSDSPYFRENLHKHESELEKTNQQIKRIIKEVKDLLAAARQLGNAQRSFASCLRGFTFECIGETQTDDEQTICSALKNFSELIIQVEEERNRMLDNANDSVLKPLEEFRKKYIGGVKNEKKKFEKQTAKFCQNQERYLNKTTKNPNNQKEADASVDMAEHHFHAASMHYVYLIQEVHERKKFEFVETLLTFVYAWFTFYHQGHELKKDFDPYMRDLQQKIQKTRGNFDDFSEKLKKRMSEVQKLEAEPVKKGCKEGYLYLLEKKAFGTAWTKHYCTYDKDKKEFTMLPYNQLTTKSLPPLEKMTITQCVRRKSDSIEKRFCFDIQAVDKPGVVYTLQALSEQDRTSWMDIMDGKEPTYTTPTTKTPLTNNEDCYVLDDVGLNFVKKCIEILEKRGLEEQGIYRVVGVTSKVSKLLQWGLDRRKNDKLNLEDPQEWESKTITSALKTYLRNLPEPLMTYKYHNEFIMAVKKESRQQRIHEVHKLLYKIPKTNFEVLKILVKHLTNVVKKSDKNLMTVSNLGVCFGPTLLRPEEETVASIMDLKFYNIVVEILIEKYEEIFHKEPANQPPKISNGPSTNNMVYNHLPPNNHLPTYTSDNDIYGSNNRTVYAQPIRVSPNYRPQPAYNQPPPYTCNVPSYIESSLPSNMYNNHDTNNDSSIYGVSRNDQRPNSRTRFKHYQDQREPNIPPPVQSYSPTNLRYTQLEPNSTSSSNDSLSSASRDGNILASNPKKTERSLHMGYPQVYKSPGNVRVRTLYACLGEHDGELSFEPNQIITNVKSSAEPGWLEGTLNGKSGLIPENYVEVLP